MGRELRRVPLDFSLPVGEIWPGFLNLHDDKSRPCPGCVSGRGGSDGMSAIGRQISDAWYGYSPFKPEDRGSVPLTPDHPLVHEFASRNVQQAPDFYGITGRKAIYHGIGNVEWVETSDSPLIESAKDYPSVQAILDKHKADVIRREAQRLCDMWNGQWQHHLNQMDVDALHDSGRLREFTHQFINGQGWVKRDGAPVPTPQQVNDWSIENVFGHDSGSQWTVIQAECYRLGVDLRCDVCDGEATLWDNEEDRLAYENWTSTEPPTGEGYQLWETVSDGSPISPVFATPEELAKWLSESKFWGTNETSYDGWMKFIQGDGWAPSFMIIGGVAMSRVEAVIREQPVAPAAVDTYNELGMVPGTTILGDDDGISERGYLISMPEEETE